MSDDQQKELEAMLLVKIQARYLELARRVSELKILTKVELAELIHLRDSLQRTAAERQETLEKDSGGDAE